MKRTPIRPALLSGSIARENLRDPKAIESFGLYSTLDRLTGIWSGLDAVRNAGDPLLTPQARALSYKAAFEKAAAVAVNEVRSTANRLLDAKSALLHDARGRAGLLVDYGNATELRAVLRAMSQSQRDAAILHAMKVGDAALMTSLQSHELLVGITSRPIAAITADFIAERAPEELAKVADLDTAAEHLELAYGQFSKSIESMRDLKMEHEGDGEAKAAREAEAKLGLALQGAAA